MGMAALLFSWRTSHRDRNRRRRRKQPIVLCQRGAVLWWRWKEGQIYQEVIRAKGRAYSDTQNSEKQIER